MLLPETETFPYCAIHPGREERNEGHLEGAGIRMGPTCEDSKMAEYNWMWLSMKKIIIKVGRREDEEKTDFRRLEQIALEKC